MFDNVKVYHENEGLCISEMHEIERKLQQLCLSNKNEIATVNRNLTNELKNIADKILNLEEYFNFYRWINFDMPFLYKLRKKLGLISHDKLLKIFKDNYGSR